MSDSRKDSDCQNKTSSQNVTRKSTEVKAEEWITKSHVRALLSKEVRDNAQFTETLQKCTDAEAKIRTLKERFKLEKKRSSTLSTTLGVENKHIAEMVEEWNTLTKIIATIPSYFEPLKKKLKESKRDINDLSEVYGEILIEQQGIKILKQQLDDVVTKLKTDVNWSTDEAKALFERRESDLINLQESCQYLEEKILQKNQLMSDVISKVRLYEQRLSEFEAEKIAMKKIIEDHKNWIAVETNYLQSSDKMNSEALIRNREKYEAELCKLKSDHEKLSAMLENTEAERKNADELIINANKCVSDLETEIQTLKTRIQELENEYERRLIKHEELIQEKDALEKQRNLQLREKEQKVLERNFEEKLLEKKELNMKLTSHLTHTLNRLSTVEDKIKNLSSIDDQTTYIEKNSSEKLNSLRNEIERLEKETEEIKSDGYLKIQDIVNREEKLHEELSRQKTKLEQSLNEVEKIEVTNNCELEQLKSELSQLKNEHMITKNIFFSTKECKEELTNKLKKITEDLNKKKYHELQMNLAYEKRRNGASKAIENFKSKELNYLNEIKELEQRLLQSSHDSSNKNLLSSPKSISQSSEKMENRIDNFSFQSPQKSKESSRKRPKYSTQPLPVLESFENIKTKKVSKVAPPSKKFFKSRK